MKLLRNLILASTAALTMLAPLAMPSIVHGDFQHRHHRYRVMYRSDPQCRWAFRGPFQHESHAHAAANELRRQGYEARVIHE